MKRISIYDLKPGVSPSEPLYTEDGKLLLAAGLPFTQEMQDALRQGAWKYVFVGEWNDADAERFARATPLATFRAEAERVSDALLHAFQTELTATDTSAPPVGLPVAENVDRRLRAVRPEGVRSDFIERRAKTTALVEDICEGTIPPDHAADATAAVVDAIVADFCADPSFAASLVHLKGAGDYLYTHSVNRAVLSLHIGAGLGYSRKQVTAIAVSALVADLGMTMVPRNIVNAPRRLTVHEFAEIQRHSMYTLHIVRKMHGLPAEAAFVAYQMHERCDGSGYPGRRKGPHIHRYAAIAAVADAFDAMTSARPWREALPPYRAMETLIKEAAAGKYDRDAVRALLQYVSLFPIGSLVRLSTGEVAKVIHTGKSFDRPVLAILFDRQGDRLAQRRVVNLSESPGLEIESFVAGSMGVPPEAGF